MLISIVAAVVKRAVLFVVALSAFFTLMPVSAHAADPLTLHRVILMQPDAVFQQRVSNSDVLAGYIKLVEAAINVSLQKSMPEKAQQFVTGGFLVIAIRPGQRSNAWFDLDEPLPDAVTDELVTRIKAVMPVVVKKGPIVFALKIGLWGGKETTRLLPSPKEWKAISQNSLEELDTEELVEKVWKN